MQLCDGFLHSSFLAPKSGYFPLQGRSLVPGQGEQSPSAQGRAHQDTRGYEQDLQPFPGEHPTQGTTTGTHALFQAGKLALDSGLGCTERVFRQLAQALLQGAELLPGQSFQFLLLLLGFGFHAFGQGVQVSIVLHIFLP